MSAIYSIANEQEIKVALLIFPYTFQLFNRSLKNPQRILTQHAREHQVDVIDFTDVFETIYDYEIKLLTSTQNIEISPQQEIEHFYDIFHTKYFKDFNHFTRRGHSVVAFTVANYLHVKGIYDIDKPELVSSWDNEQIKHMGAFRVLVSKGNVIDFLTKTATLRKLGQYKLAIALYENTLDHFDDEQIKRTILAELSQAKAELESLKMTE